jgi:hypothetical protein
MCKDCRKLGIGGKSLCEHLYQRSRCKKCKELGIGGKSLCEHYYQKSRCRECKRMGVGGYLLCEHFKRKEVCKVCKNSKTPPIQYVKIDSTNYYRTMITGYLPRM